MTPLWILQLKTGAGDLLGFEKGIAHLRKAIHMYPHGNLIRWVLISTRGYINANQAC